MSKTKPHKYTADFETTTDPNDCRVWGYALYDIYHDKINIGHDIDEFFKVVASLPDKASVYFHNLKFDGEFIIHYLFENGYTHVDTRKLENNQFQTLITDMGQYYTIKFKREDHTITFKDSLKVIPLSVAQIPKAFGVEEIKGEIDYNKTRPVGYQMTDNERDYIANDVIIVGKALLTIFEAGLTKLTQSSNAFADLKEEIGKKKFEYYFPKLSATFDKIVRPSYKGGWTYLAQRFKDRIVLGGIVLDVNSLYPYVMSEKPLPYGQPKYFKGEYEQDDTYNIYIQTFMCMFDVKEGHLPTIQLKNNLAFIPTQYLETSGDEIVTLTLTSVDLALFFDHYDVHYIEYIGGYKYKSSTTMFKSFIDKWGSVKINAEKDGNKGQRTMAKLMMNSSYGKYALSITVRNKIPYFEDGKVEYRLSEKKDRDPVYVSVASFITAYARDITIRSAQKNYDRFIYADTDSLHLVGTEIPDNIDIHPTRLGAWKLEYEFTRGKYIRAKTYCEEVEEINDDNEVDIHLEIACAGLPREARKDITLETFRAGLEVGGKLQHKRVKGGAYLKETTYKIKG